MNEKPEFLFTEAERVLKTMKSDEIINSPPSNPPMYKAYPQDYCKAHEKFF